MVAGTLNFVTMRKAITLMFALCQVTQGSTFRCVGGGGRHGDGESREPAETRATQATMRLCEGGAQGGPPHWEKPDPMGKEVQLPPLTPSSPSCWLPLVSSYSFFKVQPQSPCLWEAELIVAFPGLWQHLEQLCHSSGSYSHVCLPWGPQNKAWPLAGVDDHVFW